MLQEILTLPYLEVCIKIYSAHLLLIDAGIKADEIFVGCLPTQKAKNTVLIQVADFFESKKGLRLVIAELPDSVVSTEVTDNWITFASAVNNRQLSGADLALLLNTQVQTKPESELN